MTVERAIELELTPGASPIGRLEALLAVKNAVTLGASLIGTWVVALLVRIVLPRRLGPDAFGLFNFADNFAATFFIVLGLGIDMYIQKEIPNRPRHASEFFGGVVLVRIGLTAMLLAAMATVLALTHRSLAVQRLVLIFGVGQLFVAINANLAAMLQATSRVRGLAILNVMAKLGWAIGVVAALLGRLGLDGLAVAFVVAEVIRTIVLAQLARTHLDLRLAIDGAAVRTAILASLPFYVNAVLCTMYARVDITMLSMLSNDREVGVYSAAANFAGLALLLSPLIGWVLMPLLSRAAARSTEELYVLLRRALELVLLSAIPIALVIGVGADIWMGRVFGKAFAPGVASLRLLAPMFIFTYLAMISATSLMLLQRAWTVTLVSLGGLVLNVAIGVVVVPFGARAWGAGGAGIGAAIALLVTELAVTAAMVVAVGKRAFDRRSVRVIATAAAACLPVIALDLQIHALGPVRLLVDLVAWCVMVVAFGAVRLDELAPVARFIIGSRRNHVAAH